ncbi:MAG: hypothetical protein AAB426_15205 [Myxococcota bacterium]
MLGSTGRWGRAVPLLLLGVVGQALAAAQPALRSGTRKTPSVATSAVPADSQRAILSTPPTIVLVAATPHESTSAAARACGAAVAIVSDVAGAAHRRAAERTPASPTLRLLRLDGMRHKTDPPARF